jgi:hypothetical protein
MMMEVELSEIHLLWMAVDLLEYQQWWDNKIVLLQ